MRQWRRRRESAPSTPTPPRGWRRGGKCGGGWRSSTTIGDVERVARLLRRTPQRVILTLAISSSSSDVERRLRRTAWSNPRLGLEISGKHGDLLGWVRG